MELRICSEYTVKSKLVRNACAVVTLSSKVGKPTPLAAVSTTPHPNLTMIRDTLQRRVINRRNIRRIQNRSVKRAAIKVVPLTPLMLLLQRGTVRLMRVM